MRYYNRRTKNEAIRGRDSLTGADVVILEDDNPFFHELPEGKRLVFNGANVPTGLEDIPVDVSAIVNNHNNALESACKSYQNRHVDSNFYGLAIGLRSAGGDGEKLLAVLAWVDQIWTDYFSRKLVEEGNVIPGSLDFSNNGPCPYSFTEVRTEAGV